MFSPGQEYEAMQYRRAVLAQAENYRTIARHLKESGSRKRIGVAFGDMLVAVTARMTRFMASRLQRAAVRVERVSISLANHNHRGPSVHHAA